MGECLACPRDDKRDAEFWWRTGYVGVYPDCEQHAREQLPATAEKLGRYKQNKYEMKGPESFVSGYYTPAGESGPKIVTEGDLDAYLRANHEVDHDS